MRKILSSLFLALLIFSGISYSQPSRFGKFHLLSDNNANNQQSADEGKTIEIPGEKDDSGGTRYSIPGTPVKITFPKDWVMAPPSQDQPLYFVHPGDDWREMTIDDQDFSQMSDLKQIIQDQWKKIHQDYKNVTDLKPPSPIHGSGSGIMVMYSYKYTDDDGTIVRVIDLIVPMPRLKKALWLEGDMPDSIFEKDGPELTEIFKSLKANRRQQNQ